MNVVCKSNALENKQGKEKYVKKCKTSAFHFHNKICKIVTR